MAKKIAELNMKQAVKSYNDIMASIGYEHNMIGTEFSEDTEDWNLRDMVAECDYTLSCYYEDGHANGDMRYSEDEYERDLWKSETGALKKFIKKYEPFIKDMECATGHCSQYD
jgi:hypothetical protein